MSPRGFLALGVLALLLSAFLSSAEFSRFYQSYLFSWIFWLGLALGSRALLLVHALTSGKWGVLLGPSLKMAARTVLPLCVLALPILLGVERIYPWTERPQIFSDPALRAKATWLATGFFTGRAILYLAIWVLIHLFWRRMGAGLALVLYFLSVSFAMLDFVMSLEPHWYSTTYGFLFITLQGMSALSLATFSFLRSDSALADPLRRRDIGNLLLASVVLWTYVSFMQYLIIWSGNLPEEATWVVARSRLGWQWIVLALAIFQFAIPFVMLLFRTVKHSPRALAGVAALVLFMCLVSVYWLVVPAFARVSAFPRITDVLCWIGVGGIWLWSYRGRTYEAV